MLSVTIKYIILSVIMLNVVAPAEEDLDVKSCQKSLIGLSYVRNSSFEIIVFSQKLLIVERLDKETKATFFGQKEHLHFRFLTAFYQCLSLAGLGP
jgi:hypothetical protein